MIVLSQTCRDSQVITSIPEFDPDSVRDPTIGGCRNARDVRGVRARAATVSGGTSGGCEPVVPLPPFR